MSTDPEAESGRVANGTAFQVRSVEDYRWCPMNPTIEVNLDDPTAAAQEMLRAQSELTMMFHHCYENVSHNSRTNEQHAFLEHAEHPGEYCLDNGLKLMLRREQGLYFSSHLCAIFRSNAQATSRRRAARKLTSPCCP